MPNFSGIWTVTQQMQAKGASTWPATPGAPTIGTATAGNALCASVAFTAPACAGYPATITGYRVVSTPGCFSNTGASSPVVVSGLTVGTSYTFKAQATNSTGYGALSAASNSITASNAGQQAYTCTGSYTWVAPAGVTSVSVVAVGGGGGARRTPCNQNNAGSGGGGLGYLNNYTVTPGNSYTVVVGAGGVQDASGATSYFVSTGVVNGGGGIVGPLACGSTPAPGGLGGSYAGTSGGAGGAGGYSGGNQPGGGGGAGGYGGAGGLGGTGGGATAGTGSSGGGGGGLGGPFGASGASGGGGVGILGQGANGAGGTSATFVGGGGSGGSNGQSGNNNYRNSGGGVYGGGAGGFLANSGTPTTTAGGDGAVRIIWPGNTRSFPSTCTGNL
jgi:hypothetical protein